jgi:hypothetical protein
MDHAATSLFQALANRFGNLVRFPEGNADVAGPITHRNQGCEREATSAFDHLGNTIDEDDILRHVTISTGATRALARFLHGTAFFAATTRAAATTALTAAASLIPILHAFS